jgi:hypothetical protein
MAYSISSKRRVLFIIHVDAYFKGFIDLAAYFKKGNEFTPLLLFPRHYPNVLDHMEKCRLADIEFFSLFKSYPKNLANQRLEIFFGCCLQIVRSVIRRTIGIHLLIHMCFLVSKKHSIRKFLKAINIDVIILGGDIVGHDMALYIKAGHEICIPSLILPSWMASAREPAETYLHNPDYSLDRFLNKLFCNFFPRWKYIHKEKELIRLPAQEALALEMLQLAPPLPWILHSGYANAVAVESIEARDYGVREGLESTRLFVTGSYAHDALFIALQDRVNQKKLLCHRYGLDSSRPLIVCALPPDMLYGSIGRPECEFTEYYTLVSGFLNPIHERLQANFIVSIHPSADEDKLSYVKNYGGIIAKEPVAELICLADIYVASISATIQWAIACAIPVINYDVYRYRYSDYENLLGVLTVESQSSYFSALSLMIDEPNFLVDRAQDQAKNAKHWGLLDGKATVRISGLINDLIG